MFLIDLIKTGIIDRITKKPEIIKFLEEREYGIKKITGSFCLYYLYTDTDPDHNGNYLGLLYADNEGRVKFTAGKNASKIEANSINGIIKDLNFKQFPNNL